MPSSTGSWTACALVWEKPHRTHQGAIRRSVLIQPEELVRSPAIYPYAPTPSGFLARRLDEAAYRRASFLDERIVGEGEPAGPLPKSVLVEASCDLPRRADFVFHIGHVGSTLLARLLGESPGVFCLREPALLRPLAQARGMGQDSNGELSLDVLMRLYSRTWRTGQTALIKTTSFVSELAEDLLSQDRQARALVLSVTPPVYLRTILGGASSRAESKAMREMRRARLQRRLDLAVEVQTEGEWIAMSWLCEALCLDRVATRFGERVMWLDFDRFPRRAG